MKKIFASVICLGLIVPVAGIEVAEAAKKKTMKTYSKAERKAILAQAHKGCKKRFGAPSHVSHIEWKPLRIWCWTN
jgi:hypothetical protein